MRFEVALCRTSRDVQGRMTSSQPNASPSVKPPIARLNGAMSRSIVTHDGIRALVSRHKSGEGACVDSVVFFDHRAGLSRENLGEAGYSDRASPGLRQSQAYASNRSKPVHGLKPVPRLDLYWRDLAWCDLAWRDLVFGCL